MFFASLAGIIWLDLMLSGDNALVISLVSRELPDSKRLPAIWLGAGAAILLRIGLIGIAGWLERIPALGLGAGFYLLWVAYELLADELDPVNAKTRHTLVGAVLGIAFADMTMSLDNALAIAVLAQSDWLLMILGVAISIPIVIGCSLLINKVLDVAPWLRWCASALLGYLAGDLMVHDAALRPILSLHHQIAWAFTWAPVPLIFYFVAHPKAFRKEPKS